LVGNGELWFDNVPSMPLTGTQVNISLWSPNTNYFVASWRTPLTMGKS
jgi:hypothetical protein